MSPQVLVIVIHGVENTESVTGFATPLIEGVTAELPLLEQGRFTFTPYDWNKEIQPRELALYEACDSGLHFPFIRKLKYLIAGDVICSSRSKNGDGFLEKCFDQLDEMVALHKARHQGSPTRVVVMGHSQGSQNGLDYLFDSSFAVEGFISLGSPISIKSAQYDEFGRRPPAIRWWHNFYVSQDTISSRLATHPCKEWKGWITDHEIKMSIWHPARYFGWFNKLEGAKGIFGFIYKTLAAHTYYWKSREVHKEIAKILLEIK